MHGRFLQSPQNTVESQLRQNRRQVHMVLCVTGNIRRPEQWSRGETFVHASRRSTTIGSLQLHSYRSPSFCSPTLSFTRSTFQSSHSLLVYAPHHDKRASLSLQLANASPLTAKGARLQPMRLAKASSSDPRCTP